MNRDRAFYLVAAAMAAVVLGVSFPWLWEDSLPPGNDVTGHLQRIETIWAQWGRGHYDGWMSGAMLGYQSLLFYGPGLAIAVGAVVVLSMGWLDSGSALLVVMVASTVAIVPAMAGFLRVWGIARPVALAMAIPALAASSPRGGGAAGGFLTGLAAQQVALPLLIVALTLVVRCLRPDATPRFSPARRLALVLAAIAYTHPLSLILFLAVAPAVALAAVVAGLVTSPRDGARALGCSAAWALGLAAGWWLPVFGSTDLRGPTTAWGDAGVWEHIRLLATGGRGWMGVAGPIMTAGVAIVAVWGLGWRRRMPLALVLPGPIALGLLHAMHALAGIGHGPARQLPNRGLVVVALLSLPPVAWGVARLAPGRRLQVVIGVVAVAVTIGAIGNWTPGTAYQHRPADAAVAAAGFLAAEVGDGARLVVVSPPAGERAPVLGVPAFDRWLAWASGRDSLASFGPEYATGAGVALDLARGPARSADGARWRDDLRAVAVTHVVSTSARRTAEFADAPGMVLVWQQDEISVWQLLARDAGTEPAPGSVLPGSVVVSAQPGYYQLAVTSALARPAQTVGLGYSPGWQVTAGGRQLGTARSADGRLVIDVPAGPEIVELRFAEPGRGWWSRLASGVVLAAMMVVVGRNRWKRRNRVGFGGLGDHMAPDLMTPDRRLPGDRRLRWS